MENDIFVGDNDHGYREPDWEMIAETYRRERDEARQLYCELVIDTREVFRRVDGKTVPCTDAKEIAEMKLWDWSRWGR